MKKALLIILLAPPLLAVTLAALTGSSLRPLPAAPAGAAMVYQGSVEDQRECAEGVKGAAGVELIDPPLGKVSFLDGTNGWGIRNHGLWKTENGGRSWTPQRSAPADALNVQGTMYEVQFTSSNTGWLLESGDLLRTRDGGSSWQKLDLGKVTLDSCRFIDDKIGWCVGQRLFSDTAEEGRKWQGLVYATRDGGDTWDLQFSAPPDDLYSGFRSVYPVSARVVWAAGRDIIYTNDGGKTWKQKHITKRDELLGRIVRVEFLDAKTGWMTTNPGGLYLLTSDGGKSWQLRSGPHEEGFYDLVYTSPTEAYVAGVGVYRSSDGGLSWEKIVEGDNGTYLDLFHLKSENLLIVSGRRLIFRSLH